MGINEKSGRLPGHVIHGIRFARDNEETWPVQQESKGGTRTGFIGGYDGHQRSVQSESTGLT